MKARKVRGLDPGGTLRANAERVVATRLAELLDLADAALEGGEIAQHDMRIAAKRLRYVLEITAGCIGPEGAEGRRLAKSLQGVLGEIHDCDVMMPRVAGVSSVEQQLRARRELLFERFRALWTEAATGRTLEGLPTPAPDRGTGGRPHRARPRRASPSSLSIRHSSMRVAPRRS